MELVGYSGNPLRIRNPAKRVWYEHHCNNEQNGQLVCSQDVDRFDAIYGDSDAELTGRRIGDIRRVDDQRAAMLALAGDFDFT